MRRPSANPLDIAAVLLIVAALIETGQLHWLAGFENRLSDFFVRAHAAKLAPDPDIVIVDIDERSLASMQETAGKWVWPRSVYGELITGLERQRPRAIVFDISFSEQDTLRPDSDRAFNTALDGNTNVYLPMVRLDPAGDHNGVPIAQVAEILGLEATGSAQRDARVQLVPPQAVDEEHWRRSGLFNFYSDADGVGRRYWVAMPAYGWRIPSLPARVSADLGYAVPDQEDILLHWRGLRGSFLHISYADVYEDFGRKNRKRPTDEFTGKIVVIGSTAAALGDLRVTPISNTYPGVEILATAIDNLKNRRWMRRAPDSAQMALAAALLALV